MKLGLAVTLILLAATQFAWAQQPANTASSTSNTAVAPESPASGYTVFGATPEQEAFLRTQIQIMHPEIAPLRVFFVPHWKYLDAARTFHLHIPAGYGSLMFTHLPSRTIFIDNDRYQGEEWLGHWIAHELGHLKANTANENDAERGAREFRKLLENARKNSPTVQPGLQAKRENGN